MNDAVDKEWFKEWFDTTYYHILYKDRDHKEAELFITNLLDHLSLEKGAHCLDLACGKGRHSIFLSSKELNVTGVDLSANSIATAKKHENDHLRFDVHDMREVYRENAFDAIFNLFTSFGYFDSDTDNEHVLRAMKKMLRSDGIVVIDFMNALTVINNLVISEIKEVEGIQFSIQRKYDGQHIYKNISFEDKGHSYDFTERVQAIKKEKFVKLFDKVGFQVEHIYGDFDLSPFNADISPRLIFICRHK